MYDATRVPVDTGLAQLAGMTRRTLYRLMAPTGLQPRKVIDCARLLRAYTLLREPGSRLKETSAKLGFADPQTLSDLIREWTGQTTRSIHHGVPAATFAHLLATYLLRADDIAPALAQLAADA